jgi:sporulation protein YhbH
MSVGQQDWTLHRKGTIDQGRHIEKIKDALKENLADIISEESIITNSGEKTVKIPIKVMDDYHFRHGDPPAGSEHVAQGPGKTKAGQTVGQRKKKGDKGAGGRAAGGEPGVDYYEAEVDIESLAALIFEDLGLPRLRAVANKLVVSQDAAFTDITQKGPISNIDKRRTLKENIKRNVIMGKEPGSSWSDSDFRFRTWEPVVKEESNAVVIAIMDVSGSMGSFEKYIARSFYFWMVNFLRSKYNRVVIRFIAHTTDAKEVNEDQFFNKGESGGTMVSSGYELALQMLNEEYPVSSWNAYAFHFSDGDNMYSDNDKCLELMRKLCDRCNQVGYGQIQQYSYDVNMFGTSSFSTLYTVYQKLEQHKNFVSALIKDKKDIWPTLKKFFNKELQGEV